MEIVPQLVQAVLVVVLCAIILVIIPFLFMIVFGFAYGGPSPSGAARHDQPAPPSPPDDEAAERE